MSGDERRMLFHGWLCGLAIIVGVVSMNILTRHHDEPEIGLLPPLIWEGSSALIIAVIILMPGLMVLWTRRARPPWWIALPAHLASATLFSVLHVAAFVVLRKVAYALWMDGPYRFSPAVSEFLYEFRKDVVVYAFSAAIYWVLNRLRAASTPAATAVSHSAAAAQFDIRDGARLVRAPIGDILAVRSAGNYAEFVLADGRRPLMRSSLSALEASLGAHGFLRTHRSWLVNPTRVTGLKPEGSGDYAVELGNVEAPLSRRFPQALMALRG